MLVSCYEVREASDSEGLRGVLACVGPVAPARLKHQREHAGFKLFFCAW